MSQTSYAGYFNNDILKEFLFGSTAGLRDDFKLESANDTSSRYTEILEAWLQLNKRGLSKTKEQVSNLWSQLKDQLTIKVVVNYDNEVPVWCAEHGIILYLQKAEELIQKHFPTVQKINFTVEYDPELEREWISANLELPGDIDQIVEWEDNFVSEWVASTPYPERDNISISFDII